MNRERINRFVAEDTGHNDLKITASGELGFLIVTARELLNAISEVGPSKVTGFTAALSTIIETAFDDPEDRQRIATLLYREFGGDGKCMKF